MSSFDKAIEQDALIALGWREATPAELPADVRAGSGNVWQMVPPDSLFRDRPRSFNLDDALALQNLLGETVET
jgi:hypothetical protein